MLILGGQAASRKLHRSLFSFRHHSSQCSVSHPLLPLPPPATASLCLVPSPSSRRRSRKATTMTTLRFLFSLPADSHEPTSALRFSQLVADGLDKARLDAWLASRMEGVSRARIQASIRAGLVLVNGKPVKKVSQVIKMGDWVDCSVAELEPLRAKPEDIPINTVYEDDHVLVVNKPPNMVVHPAPGHPNGTLVNAILHHCGLPAGGLDIREDISDTEDDIDDLCNDEFHELLVDKKTAVCDDSRASASIRPGIVHRLDKGTSGLLVVAKVPGDQVLACGGSALVEWRLETGRTHQIRAHAKYLGIPLLGDEVYGGTEGMVLSRLQPRIPSSCHTHLFELVSNIQRPCLHALTLGFKHPHTGEDVKYSCPPPPDFTEILCELRKFGSKKDFSPV